jgi:hypothetical protein
MAKKHSRRHFTRWMLDGPIGAAVFSVLLKLAKEMDKADRKNGQNEIELTSHPQS